MMQLLHRGHAIGENAMIHTHGKGSWSDQLLVQRPGIAAMPTTDFGVPENCRDQSGPVMTC